MNIDQLEYFRSVAKTGSFSQAARELWVSQPALSMAIRQLEEELGYELFDRCNTGVNLTKKGQSALLNAIEALEAVGKMHQLNSQDMQISGVVKLYCFPAFYNFLADSVLANITLHYPEIELHLEEAFLSDLKKEMTYRDEHVIFVVGIRGKYTKRWQKELEDLGWTCEFLYKDQLVAFLSKDHYLNDEQTLCAASFKDCRFATFTQHVIQERCVIFDEDIFFDKLYKYKDGKSLKRALVLLNAVSVLPSLFAYSDPQVQNGEIKVKDVVGADWLGHFLVYHQKSLKIADRVVLDIIRSVYKNISNS